ncbi:MAG TPA: hypothetical protein VGK73_39070 [Polyangiaceae bacterium]
MKRPTLLLVLCATLGFSAPVWGQEPDEATRTAARALGTSGVEAYQAGDFAMATDKLEKAYGILRVPSLGLWSARALVQNGKWVEALDRYLEVASLQVPSGEYAVQKQAQADADTDRAALKPRIPVILVRAEGAAIAETEVSIDGRVVPSALAAEGRLVNPGKHVIEGKHAGTPARVELTVKEGQRETAVLRFGAASPAPGTVPPTAVGKDSGSSSDGSTQRVIGWTAVGTGAVGIAVGTVFGIMAIGQKGDIDDNAACVDNRCAPSETDDVDSYNTARTVSSVGLIAGGVLAGVGVVLLVTAPSGKARAEAWISPNAAGLRGRF